MIFRHGPTMDSTEGKEGRFRPATSCPNSRPEEEVWCERVRAQAAFTRVASVMPAGV
jgi:hypothetical protein